MRNRKCFREVAGFDDRALVMIGLPMTTILVTLLLFGDLITKGEWKHFLFCVPVSFLYTAMFWMGMRTSYHYVKTRYPAFRDIDKRIFWVSIAFVVLYLCIKVLDTYILCIFLANSDHVEPARIVEITVTFIISALVITIYEAISFYIQLQKALTEKADIERHYVQSQLEGLRNQVNPHFLFNSLNTLTYLIPENADKAVNFVQKLSKVYRYILESRDAKVIPLREEMDYLHAFIFLLRERFGDNLNIDIRDLRPVEEQSIVPLSLQMLFENAIKHNIISTEKPLYIEVFEQNGHLVVRNNLQRKNQVMDSTGVGLDNIRARYQMLTDQKVEVIVSQQYFTVLLPLIKEIGNEELRN